VNGVAVTFRLDLEQQSNGAFRVELIFISAPGLSYSRSWRHFMTLDDHYLFPAEDSARQYGPATTLPE
jgi:hypothetical protein